MKPEDIQKAVLAARYQVAQGNCTDTQEALVALADTPLPIRLNCPVCGMLHLDEGEFATKAHHTHSCQGCGMTWRPAVVPTIGVQFLPGFKNNPQS